LSLVRDLQAVGLPEVLGDGDPLTVSHGDVLVARTTLEVDSLHDIDFPVSVIGDHRFLHESFSAFLLKIFIGNSLILVSVVGFIVDVLDLFQDSSGGEEPTAVVNDERAASLVLVCRCLESLPNLHSELVACEWLCWIKELWSVTDLD